MSFQDLWFGEKGQQSLLKWDVHYEIVGTSGKAQNRVRTIVADDKEAAKNKLYEGYAKKQHPNISIQKVVMKRG